jgi:rubrerythrin
MEREPDLIFEAICEVCGIDWKHEMTQNERGRVNAARKELVDLYGDIQTLPMMIHERGSAYRQVYPDMPLTPQALTGNWGSVLALAETAREQARQKQTEQRRVTNAHAKRGCQTCGDDHFVSVGYDADGNEQTAPCPDCNTNSDATYWVNRRKVEPMDPAKTREMMG